jgi:hypothetical protein
LCHGQVSSSVIRLQNVSVVKPRIDYVSNEMLKHREIASFFF